MKKALYLPLILLIIMSLNSCQKNPTNVDLESISKSTWRLIYWEENKLDKKLYPEGLPFIKFTNEGKISGSTGCNSYQANITIEEANIIVTDFSMSYVGCAKELSDTEAGNTRGLKNSNKLFLEGNTLIFMKDDVVLLRYTK